MDIKKVGDAIQNIADHSAIDSEKATSQAQSETNQQVDSLELGRADNLFAQPFVPSAEQENMERIRSLFSGFMQSAEGSNSDQQLAAMLEQELQNAGLNVDQDKLTQITDAITKGGEAGMALAITIVMNLAEVGGAASPGATGAAAGGADAVEAKEEEDPAGASDKVAEEESATGAAAEDGADAVEAKEEGDPAGASDKVAEEESATGAATEDGAAAVEVKGEADPAAASGAEEESATGAAGAADAGTSVKGADGERSIEDTVAKRKF